MHKPQRRSKFTSVNVHEVHTNVSQEIIEITADKLTIILNEHIDSLAKNKEWQTPLSLIITIMLVLSTTSFRVAFGLAAETWSAIFILSCGICVMWLIKTLLDHRSAISVADILRIIKNKE